MKIAVAYDNGNVFGHFGKTEFFKIYEVKENKILSSEILPSNTSGHNGLAKFLSDSDVSLVICGGMGEGAQSALTDLGIVVCSGASGDADEAVSAFLRGELESSGVNCEDHHSEEHSCCCGGDDEEAGCGGGCGGCGGGCHSRIMLEGPNAGKTMRVHYKGTFNDGTQFDSSYDRGEPLEFVCGAGMMIRGFDVAVLDMKVGEVKDIHLMPEEAYGEADPNAIFTVPLADLPGAEELNTGDQAYLTNMMGQPFMVKVVAKTPTDITFDANHEMAGKELNFRIEVVEIV